MSRIDKGLRFLQARGVQRGVFGSSRGWFWVAVSAWLFRRARRMIGSQPEVVFRGEVKPGHAIRIDHLLEEYGASTRRRRFRR